MAFTVSRRTLWVALVVAVIILILIVIRMRTKSTYAYPDAVAGAKVARIVSTVTSPTPGSATITTTAAHGFALNDAVLYGSPAVAYVITAVPSTTQFTISAAAATNSAAALAAFPATTLFTPAYKTLTDALEECNVIITNGGNADTCITNATTSYYTSMCPWTTNNPTSATLPVSVWAAYQTFMTNIASSTSLAVSAVDTNSIGSAYIGVKNAGNTAMMTVINAARKADITGATRRYLSTVCPNYYVTASGTATPSNYSTWGVFSGAAPTPAGGSAPTYYFDSSKIKFTDVASRTTVANRLKEWAKYAAADPNAATPTALIPGCTLFSATTTGSSVQNYKLAQQYGPGTVNTGLGFNLPWNIPESTCNTAVGTSGIALI